MAAPPIVPLPAAPPTTRVEASLISRVCQRDQQAIVTMFQQFIPPEEQILVAEYLGFDGFWIFGRHSLGVLTNARAGGIRITRMGEVVYQDAFLEATNSCAFYQPSKLPLYVGLAVVALGALGMWGGTVMSAFALENLVLKLITFLGGTLGIALVALILAIVVSKLYHWGYKSGVVMVVQEGLSVYLFTDRGRLGLANRLYQMHGRAREARIKALRAG